MKKIFSKSMCRKILVDEFILQLYLSLIFFFRLLISSYFPLRVINIYFGEIISWLNDKKILGAATSQV